MHCSDRSIKLHFCLWRAVAGGLVLAWLLLAGGCSAFSNPEPSPPQLPPQTQQPQNQPPTIKSVRAMTDGKSVLSFTECQIICDASDADSDTLSYKWTATGGIIKGAGSGITWTAPDPAGTYAVTAIVSDGKGGEAIGSVAIPVIAKPNRPPVILKVMVARDDGGPANPVTEEERKVYKIAKHNAVTLKCIAEDPDGDKMNFVWETTGGTIKSQGAEVGWIAPGQPGEFTVTVRAVDTRGVYAEASILFDVLCCGH